MVPSASHLAGAAACPEKRAWRGRDFGGRCHAGFAGPRSADHFAGFDADQLPRQIQVGTVVNWEAPSLSVRQLAEAPAGKTGNPARTG